MIAQEVLSEPILEDVVIVTWDKQLLGKSFKKEAQVIMDHVASLTVEQVSVSQVKQGVIIYPNIITDPIIADCEINIDLISSIFTCRPIPIL